MGKIGTAVEISTTEVVAINDRSAVRDVGVVVVNHTAAVPVVSPVPPAPPESSEETNSKSDTKIE